VKNTSTRIKRLAKSIVKVNADYVEASIMSFKVSAGGSTVVGLEVVGVVGSLLTLLFPIHPLQSKIWLGSTASLISSSYFSSLVPQICLSRIFASDSDESNIHVGLD
jgi:hypothetical protein